MQLTIKCLRSYCRVGNEQRKSGSCSPQHFFRGSTVIPNLHRNQSKQTMTLPHNQPSTHPSHWFWPVRRRTIRALLVLAACCGALLCHPAQAQQNKPSTQETSSEDVDAEQVRLTYYLGRFEIREIRPTRNETTRINFEAHFAMSPEVSKQDIEKLKHWKHRFRNQVIVAVRTAQTKDFQEPELQRLRRIILFRVGRMMREALVEDILFSEFTFSME